MAVSVIHRGKNKESMFLVEGTVFPLRETYKLALTELLQITPVCDVPHLVQTDNNNFQSIIDFSGAVCSSIVDKEDSSKKSSSIKTSSHTPLTPVKHEKLFEKPQNSSTINEVNNHVTNSDQVIVRIGNINITQNELERFKPKIFFNDEL
jgi:hypothetical protein